jgi:ATP-binding cassette subfamily B protein
MTARRGVRRRSSGWRLARYARRRVPSMSVMLTSLLAGSVLDVVKPWPMKILVDDVLRSPRVPHSVTTGFAVLPGGGTRSGIVAWLVIGTVLLFAFGWLADMLSAYASVVLGQKMTFDLAGDLFAHLQRLSLRFHARTSVGDTIRRVIDDSGCVASIVQGVALPLVTSTASLIMMFAVMWRLNAELALVALCVVPVIAAVVRRYAGPMAERSYRQHDAEGAIYDTIEQTLTAIPVIQAFGGEAEREQRFRGDTARALAAVVTTTNVQLTFKVLVGLTTTLGTAAIIWVGAEQALAHHLTLGTLLVLLSYLASLYTPIEATVYSAATFSDAMGSARRVVEVLDVPPEVVDRPGAPALGRVRGAVGLADVWFGYLPDRPVLRGVSLELAAGETVAVVGVTGAGKSTLAGLVARMFDPWRGSVSIDGRDVREVSLASVRRAVSLVLQDSLLFPVSVAANIGYGRPEASRAEIVAAARAVGADGFIERLPDGYDTVLGERGGTLSGGERQRLAVARALLKDAPVLVLDEPTSALDVQTEAGLLAGLRRLMAGRTTLIIAHRLSTVREADRIAVVAGGRIVELGGHRQLLDAGGRYARMVAAQQPRPPAAGAPEPRAPVAR